MRCRTAQDPSVCESHHVNLHRAWVCPALVTIRKPARVQTYSPALINSMSFSPSAVITFVPATRQNPSISSSRHRASSPRRVPGRVRQSIAPTTNHIQPWLAIARLLQPRLHSLDAGADVPRVLIERPGYAKDTAERCRPSASSGSAMTAKRRPATGIGPDNLQGAGQLRVVTHKALRHVDLAVDVQPSVAIEGDRRAGQTGS